MDANGRAREVVFYNLIEILEGRINSLRLKADFNDDMSLETQYAIVKGYEQAVEDCRHFLKNVQQGKAQ